MADLARKTASIYINHQAAEDALIALQKQADKLQTKIKAGEAAGKNMVAEIAKLNKVTNDIKAVQNQIDKGLRPSFNQLQTTVSRLRNELKRMSEDAPGYAAKFKAFNAASTELQRMQNAISGVTKQTSLFKDIFTGFLAGAGAAVSVNAVVGFFKDATQEALDAEKSTARLKNTLNNLGNTDAFNRLMDKADEMAARFKFIDNDDVVGVFEQLITYGKLTEDQINKLTPVIINFAAKARISLAESTSVIIKALEGNGRALKEYGINVKDAKTETERLNIIMSTLKEKTEGAADAFGETTQGKIATFEQSIKNLKESIGTFLLPVLQGSINLVNTLASGISETAQDIKNLAKDLTSLGGRGARKQQEDLDARAEEIRRRAREITADQATKSLKEQQDIVRQNKVLFEDAQQEFIKYEKGTDVSSERTKRMVDDLLLQKEIYKQSVKQLEISKETKTLGGGVDDEALKLAEEERKKAAKKAAEAAKKAADELKRLRKELSDFLKQINGEYDKATLDAFSLSIKQVNDATDAELAKLIDFKNKKLITAKEYADEALKIEEIRAAKINDILNKEIKDQAKKVPAPIINGNSAFEGFNEASQKKIAALQAKLITSNGKERLALQLQILDAQRLQELNNVNLTEEQKNDIIKKYDQLRSQLKIQKFVDDAKQIINVGQSLADAFSAFDAVKNAKDENQINAITSRYDKESAANKKLLDQKIIDQLQYDKREKLIAEKKEKEVALIKRRQFERNKRAAIIDAAITGAQTILNALQTKPFLLGLVLAGVAAVKTEEQIRAIKTSNPPEFARGGIFDGPSHAQGGMPVINPATGRKVAELEGGEPILSRRTYANNKPLVDALLHSSMYGGGQPISPAYAARPYMGMNFAKVNNTLIAHRKYERGGVFTADGSTSADGGLANVLNALVSQLQQPQKNYVVFSEVNAAMELDDKVKAATTFKR